MRPLFLLLRLRRLDKIPRYDKTFELNPFLESITERLLVRERGEAVCADLPRRRESLLDEKMAACS
jgi:hypothetical protein